VADAAANDSPEGQTVIEWLTFRVPSADQARFLELDAAIWTLALAACPGFLGKEVWRAATDPEVLNLIIRWQSRAEWKAVPPALLAETETRFAAAFGRSVPAQSCTDLDVLG
jgi:uncharacterized protein (TIGR03792 family)